MKRDWLPLISNAAIVIGLVIVIYELDQNRQHVRADLLKGDFTDILAHNFTLMGEAPAEAIAIAMNDPDSLSDEQKLVVNAHLRALFVRLDSYCYIADSTGVYDDESCYGAAPRILKEYFGYSYAREWWGHERTIPRPWAQTLYAMFDEELGYSN